MDALRRIRTLAVATTAAGLAFSPLLYADDAGRDGIARNLLERQQQEVRFGAKLDDSPTRVVPGNGVTPPAQVDNLPRRQLDEIQLRRLLELQLQNKNQDENVRQQQTQTQQLQFDRENQAQHLQQQIQRDSRGSMQQIR